MDCSLTTGRPRSGYFGLGNSFLLSASFLSSVGQDEASSEPDNPLDDDDENGEDPENDSIPSYLMPQEELDKVKVEVIDGDKAGSKWLVLDDVFMLYKYGYEGKEETFWECSERRRNKCRFKAATLAGDDTDNVALSYTSLRPIPVTKQRLDHYYRSSEQRLKTGCNLSTKTNS